MSESTTLHTTRSTTASVLRWTLAVAAMCASGCSSAPVAEPSPTFSVRPAAKTPVMAFLWEEQVASWRYLDIEPKEFAAPAHVGATDEVVIATQQGEVVKFQAANGEVLWRRRMHDAVYHAGPIVGSHQVFVADLEGTVRSLDLQTGEPGWEFRVGTSVESRGTYYRGRLFISDAADVLWAFDAETGESLWTHTREVPSYFTIKGSCTPVPDGDVVYCGFSDGHLLALSVDTGELVWDADLTGGKEAFVDIDGPVRIVGPRIYATSYAGGVFALDRRTGEVLWRQDVESAADVTYAGDKLFVVSAIGHITAHALTTGEPLWRFRTSKSFPGSAQPFGPYLMVFATDGPVYVLDAATGYLHQKWRGTSGFLAPPELGGSRVYALSNSGQLFGLKLGW